MSLNLSSDQASACERIREWVFARCNRWSEGEDSEILKFGGYAGTGKTTVLGVLAKEFAEKGILVAYATFTGRASSILCKKLEDQGVITSTRLKASSDRPVPEKFAKFFLKGGEERMPFCGTLHRLLYAPFINEETEELLGWRTRPRLDRRYGLIVIDEASMVGDKMLADIVRHGVPILAVGDHGQLAPVKDAGSLMKAPDIRLEKIHRQAEGNPIIQMAHTIRSSGVFDRKLLGAQIVGGARMDLEKVYRAAWQDAIDRADTLSVGALCWTNKTRTVANRTIRKALGFSGPPKRGEVLMCLRNSEEVQNGMRGVLTADGEQLGWQLDCNITFPNDDIRGDFSLCSYQFNREKTFASVEELQKMVPSIKRMSEGGLLFDFGYCATVHKFQGSQLKHAIIIVDRPMTRDEETRRFYYTAVTRASDKLTILF